MPAIRSVLSPVGRAALAAAALVGSALLSSACTHEYRPYRSPDEPRSFELGGAKVAVEVAKDGPSRHRGLQNRASMPPDHGMLFVYPEPRILRFWMKDCSIPLSIAFFEELKDGGARVVNIEDMQPFDETGTLSARPVRLALEMNQGWFARHGVKAGDTVALPPWVQEIVASEDT
jgi:hypothetical protein